MLWDIKNDSPANAEQKMALLMRGMNEQHSAQVHGPSDEAKDNLVPEMFCGKHFDHPGNDLLYWVRHAETEDETDAEGP